MVFVRRSRSAESGFTLIEVALVVMVGGILLAMFSGSLINMIRDANIKTTQIRIEEINKALRRYSNLNNKLPCAAARDIPPEDASYGAAPATCAISGTVLNAGVRIGMVPTRTLNLPDEYGYDAWGSRFIYAVTEALTNSTTYNVQSGSIAIVDANNVSAIQPAGKGTFLIVSVGPDRKGGYNIEGAMGNTCTGTGLDIFNCDDNATFRTTLQTSETNGGLFFDDYISYASLDVETSDIPTGAIIPFNLATCPKGWDELPAARGHFIIGAGLSVSTTVGPPTPTPVDTVPASAYTGQSFTAGQKGGYASRADTSPLPTPLGEYGNLPPYAAYLYCVKN